MKLEEFWDLLLSREKEKIRKSFSSLDPLSKQEVISHLKKMTSEPGWHPEQVISAKIALDTISELRKEAP